MDGSPPEKHALLSLRAHHPCRWQLRAQRLHDRNQLRKTPCLLKHWRGGFVE